MPAKRHVDRVLLSTSPRIDGQFQMTVYYSSLRVLGGRPDQSSPPRLMVIQITMGSFRFLASQVDESLPLSLDRQLIMTVWSQLSHTLSLLVWVLAEQSPPLRLMPGLDSQRSRRATVNHFGSGADRSSKSVSTPLLMMHDRSATHPAAHSLK